MNRKIIILLSFFLPFCFSLPHSLAQISTGSIQTGSNSHREFALPSQTQTFKSSKIKINNYGTREQTSTISPNIISLNLYDSLIIIQPQHPGINEFLGHQNQFEISKSFGTGITTRVYFTTSEYVFTIDSKMRVVVISQKEISPKVHSVWLEEISN